MSDSNALRSSPEDTQTLSALLEQAAHNERILRRYQAFELELLAADGLSGVIAMLLERAPQHFKLDAVELWLLDAPQALRGLVDAEQPLEPGLLWLDEAGALRELYGVDSGVKLLSVDDGGSLGHLFHGRRMRSAALLPLRRHGQLIGSLHFGSFSGQRFTADKSSDFIAHLGMIVALCLENAVNQERLRHLSLIDVLTRVHNRRAFDQAMELELARAVRHHTPLALLLVDLDHFKRVNDDYGHLTGDRVLVAVAQEIATMLRKTDHVCRYGGEEFALLLPDCGRELALEVAERVRERVAALEVVSDSGITLNVSLSVGVSGWAAEGSALPGLAKYLLAAADEALYAAKKSGRDQVAYRICFYPEAV